MNGKFAHERIGLGQPVVVEHGEPVLLAEPADRLGVERLARRAHDAELLRERSPASPSAIIARIAVGVVKTFVTSWRQRKSSCWRGRSRPCAGTRTAGAVAPRAEQRRDAGGPGPLAHAVEALAVLHVVAVDELLVGEDVAMGVHDALGQPGRAGRVVELGRVLGRGVGGLELGRRAGEQRPSSSTSTSPTTRRRSGRVGRVGDEHPRPASRSGGGGCRRRRRAPTSTAGSRRASRCRRRSPRSRGSAAARPRRGRRASTPCSREQLRGLVGEVLELAPVELARRPVVALPDHRRLVARVLVADVRGDVVALGDAPLVLGAQLVVRGRGARCHGLSSRLRSVRDGSTRRGCSMPTEGSESASC